MSGGMDEDRVDANQRFTARSKSAQQDKMVRTALLRAEEQSDVDVDALPVGQVMQVYSLFTEVEHQGKTYLSVVRKTMAKLSDTAIVVGDLVRFRDVTSQHEAVAGVGDGKPPAEDAAAPPAPQREAVIEQVLPRKTILLRSESYKGLQQHPIVANAEQMLIVVSLRSPAVKWGLVDRMIVAAQSGGLKPIVCLNKLDLATGDGDVPEDLILAREALAHYASLGIESIQTSAERAVGLEQLTQTLAGHTTVLSGHSGVGKSSLVRSIQPQLDLKVGEVSRYTDKGRHTTTSARRYPLDFGGAVIDTPGVKLFGLWGVSKDNLLDYFPDVQTGAAPAWRKQSYERIASSLS